MCIGKYKYKVEATFIFCYIESCPNLSPTTHSSETASESVLSQSLLDSTPLLLSALATSLPPLLCLSSYSSSLWKYFISSSELICSLSRMSSRCWNSFRTSLQKLRKWSRLWSPFLMVQHLISSRGLSLIIMIMARLARKIMLRYSMLRQVSSTTMEQCSWRTCFKKMREKTSVKKCKRRTFN